MFLCVWPSSMNLPYKLEWVVVVAPWAAGRPGVARPGPAWCCGAVQLLGAWPGLGEASGLTGVHTSLVCGHTV